MEYLEGFYYNKEGRYITLFRFYKNQKFLASKINAKLNDMPIISKWFDLDENGKPKGGHLKVCQYFIEGKKISLKAGYKINFLEKTGLTTEEYKKGNEYNGEIISNEELLIESNHSGSILYKKYLEGVDYTPDDDDDDYDEEEELIEPDFELTEEMIYQIKNEIIPELKYDGINSRDEYIKANEDFYDNVDLFQRITHTFPVDEVLKINKNEFTSESEYLQERTKRWDEKFIIDEEQLIINLGMIYLESTEW